MLRLKQSLLLFVIGSRMSDTDQPGQKLKAGEHYGSVFHKCRLPTAIVTESVYPTSLCLPEHSHELGFFTLIIDGYYSEVVKRKDVLYSPQTVLWREAETSHKDRIETNSSRFFFVEIESNIAEKLKQHGSVPDRLAEKNGTLTWLASRLRHEIANCCSGTPLIAEGITLEMLGHLTRTNTITDRQPPRWVVRVAERLNEEFAAPLTNEELAATEGVHPVYLAAAFRRFYHQTIGEYVQHLRIERAASLLRDQEIPLCEVAFECGFADQSHFTRVFKRVTGLTPGRYRSSLG